MPTPLAIEPGLYYSNGAYGRNWGVRLVLTCESPDGGSEPEVTFKGVAGTCRRKTGRCALGEFRRWARYRVALNENSWQRIGGDDAMAED